MFLTWRLLQKIFLQSNIWKLFQTYLNARKKRANNAERCSFLKKCLDNDIIPGFLRLRVPETGCFDRALVHNFQKRLLRKELLKAEVGLQIRVYSQIVRNAVSKIVQKETQLNKNATKKSDPLTTRPTLMLQNRGRESDHFARQLRSQNVSTIFTTRKLRSCLPSLKSKVIKPLTSRVVYRIQCPGCISCYVGRTARHLTTRLTEHKRRTSPLGAHFSDCKVCQRQNFRLLFGHHRTTYAWGTIHREIKARP